MDFHRIKRLPPYVFEQVNRLKAEARGRGEDIIDFGMGNPDMPTPAHIVDKLVETARSPKANRYSASKGVQGLRKAQAAYYDRRFGVKLNPDEVRRQKYTYLLGRPGTMRECAYAALFLASDESSFVTGHALMVDGGLTAQLQDAASKYVEEQVLAEMDMAGR